MKVVHLVSLLLTCGAWAAEMPPSAETPPSAEIDARVRLQAQRAISVQNQGAPSRAVRMSRRMIKGSKNPVAIQQKNPELNK